jgi:hypothetical protein
VASRAAVQRPRDYPLLDLAAPSARGAACVRRQDGVGGQGATDAHVGTTVFEPVDPLPRTVDSDSLVGRVVGSDGREGICRSLDVVRECRLRGDGAKACCESGSRCSLPLSAN